ncbi:MAG: GTPase [Bacteroidia bacterium]
MTKCGYVSVVGRPNAGKSSLLNWLVGEKIAMVSHKANATRKRSNIIVMHNDDQIPKTDDPRAFFYKGLFQDTLPSFIEKTNLDKKLIIHLDADLYTATYYVLNWMAPYLKKGDIIFFDEFSVPLSEFKAFTEFQRSHYLKFKLIGSVNNFYQAAFIVE